MAQFVDELFRQARDGLVVLQGLRKAEAVLQGAEALDRATAPRAFSRLFAPDEFDELVDLALNWNARQGVGVFVSAGLRREDLDRASPGLEADVIAVTALKADLDAEGALARALDFLERNGISPNFIHRTGTLPYERGHLWWLLDEPELELARVRKVEQALRQALGGDSVFDARRVMRLPGSVNWASKSGRVDEVTTMLRGRKPAYSFDELFSGAMHRITPSASPPADPPPSGPEDQGETSKLARLVRQVDRPGEWHNSVRSLAAGLVARGVPLDAAEELLVRSARQPGFSAEQTRADVRELVRSAGLKFSPRADSARQRDYSMSELQRRELPEPTWIANGLVPEGLSMLAAKPKAGKSWLALDLGASVATGAPFLDRYQTEMGDVLYCALEDTPRRMQNRGQALFGEADWPERLRVRHELPKIDAGGMAVLEEWARNCDAPRLCIIDVWSIAKPRPSKTAEAYDANYAALAPLKQFSATFGVGVVLVHHERKMPPAGEDPFETILGSTALRGGMDALFLLHKTKTECVLKREGRDLDETEDLNLRFDKDSCRFVLMAAPEARPLTEAELEVVETLSAAGDAGLAIADLAAALHIARGTAKQRLYRMKSRNLVRNRGGDRFVNVETGL